MDIPRGTFSSIRRDTLLSDVLVEIRETSFSGYATVGCRGDSVSLVFSEGACILAEYRGLQGRAAWQEIQELGGEKVEAGMYLLTPQQIKLASEFNKNAAIPVTSSPPQQVNRERGRDAAATRISSAKKDNATAGHLRLPRGTFCEIRRDISVNEVIDDLQKAGFSGYGLFSGDSGTFSLVFFGGVCILAECDGERGPAALEMAKAVERLSEVSLYALSGQQVSLAIEFNDGYGIRAPAGGGAGPRKSVVKSGEVVAPSRPASPVSPPPPRVQERVFRKREEPVSAPMSDLALLDMEGLDAIDPVAMAADLKSSYVSILDRLELGHLVDTKEEKECD